VFLLRIVFAASNPAASTPILTERTAISGPPDTAPSKSHNPSAPPSPVPQIPPPPSLIPTQRADSTAISPCRRSLALVPAPIIDADLADLGSRRLLRLLLLLTTRMKLSRRSTRIYADDGLSTIINARGTRVNGCDLDTFQRAAGTRTLSGQRSSPYAAFLYKRRVMKSGPRRAAHVLRRFSDAVRENVSPRDIITKERNRLLEEWSGSLLLLKHSLRQTEVNPWETWGYDDPDDVPVAASAAGTAGES
jgi:hypothetical protein